MMIVTNQLISNIVVKPHTFQLILHAVKAYSNIF